MKPDRLTNKQLLAYALLGLLIFGGFIVLGFMNLAITPIS